MTNKELQEELKKYPDDSIIEIYNYSQSHYLKIIEISYNKDYNSLDLDLDSTVIAR